MSEMDVEVLTMGRRRLGHRRIAGGARRWTAVISLCLVMCVGNLTPIARAVVPTVDPGGFAALPPSRLLDTRTTGTPIGSDQTRPLKVTGVGGVPSSGVSAVVLSVTVTDTTSIGYLTVSPTGTTRPVVSNLNWSAGATIPNAVTVKVDTNGQVDLYQSGPGSANVIVDVAGYYIDGAVVAPGGFTALAPSRILDTRNGGNGGGKLASNETRDLTILGSGGIPANVSAVVLNVTITDTTSTGYLTVFPSSTNPPLASNLNWSPGLTIPNLVTVKVGGNGKVSFFQSGPGTASLVVDVAGYFLDGSVTQLGMYVPLSPARILDTRNNANPLRAFEDRQLIVAGTGGVPATGVGAVVMNTTVTQTGTAGYLTVHPGYSPAPLASNLNWSGPGATIPNLVTVQLGSSGSVGFRNGSGLPTHVIADVAGYYVGVTPAPMHVTAVASGGYHTCGVVAGQVWCWGQNKYGQLGNGTTADSTTAVPVAGGLTNVAAIVAGESHTCALSNGAVYCWGWNDSGQVGDGSTATRSSPVKVSNLSGVSAIAAGKQHTCAVASGSVWCWGSNGNGQLGDGTTTTRSAPVKVAGLSGMVSVAAGWGHTCARSGGGGVLCWGWNFNGQLGDGTNTTRSAPVAVWNLSGATAISAGYDHTCAATSGSVVCWGLNGNGQLGNGNTVEQWRPVTVSGLAGVTVLSAGDGHVCVVAGDSTASCWGQDDMGQLGDGGTTDQLSPTSVLDLPTVKSVAAGRAQTCALTTVGGVMCWGDNTYGQLGDGTTTDTTTPVAVTGFA
jgi:alpha-tubulin suppressor-like RCC1 family protein